MYDTLPPPLPTLFPCRLIVHGPLWAKIEEFMQQFDVVQVRYAGHEMKKLIDKVASVARSSSNVYIAARFQSGMNVVLTILQLRSAILPIRSAILRLDPSGACLTSTHLLFVRLCLEARACEDALPVVEKHIHSIAAISDKGILYDAPRYLCQNHPSSATIFSKASNLSNALDCKDIMKYFLHTGMIFMGLKKWEEAIKSLDMVIAHPTSGNASMIQIQAYKKWILAAILEHGHVRIVNLLIYVNLQDELTLLTRLLLRQ